MSSTLLQLKTRARELSDMEDSNFISDSELNSYINQSALELYDLIVASYEDYYISVSSESTLTTGQDSITIPSDFYKLRGVDFKVSDDRWIDLKPFSFQDRNEPNYNRQTFSNETVIKYRLQGNNIKLTPSQLTAGVYRIWYIPKMTNLSSDSTELPAYLEPWDEYIVVDSAIKMLQKEESSTNTLEGMKEALKKRIQGMSRSRDSAHPEVILPSQRKDFWWWGY